MDGDLAPLWTDVGRLDDIPPLGSRVVSTPEVDIAVFRTADDRVFALHDRCPHKAGKLSQGIVHGEQVTCPLHNWVIGLSDGRAKDPDEGCANTVPVRLDGDRILLGLIGMNAAGYARGVDEAAACARGIDGADGPARGAGWDPARQINEIPAGCPPAEESAAQQAGLTRS